MYSWSAPDVIAVATALGALISTLSVSIIAVIKAMHAGARSDTSLAIANMAHNASMRGTDAILANRDRISRLEQAANGNGKDKHAKH